MRSFAVGVMVLALVAALSVAACGKKSAPVPPEDVPPDKQERSN